MENKDYIGYEYKEISVPEDKIPFYLDTYENFGWQPCEKILPKQDIKGNVTTTLKRDRKMLNKMELTRLERQFESCLVELGMLEKSKDNKACLWSLVIGIIGTAFMAGSTFAVTATPPIIWLCVVLAIPGFIGWIFPPIIYRKIKETEIKRIEPLIEAKYDEIHSVCEKGNKLLH